MTLPPPECRVYTPPPLADAMVQAIEPTPYDYWLDPCMGPGVFVACLRKKGVHKEHIVGIDIDPDAGAEDDSATTVRGIDFFEWCTSTTQKFNRIVANPPYVAIRKLHPTLQQSLATFGTGSDGSFALRSNYWCAFLSACFRVLANHGSLAFVLPAAWDYAQYASDVRRAVHQQFQSVEVHRSREPLFPEVREGCVVLVAKGYRKAPARSVRINHSNAHALITALLQGDGKPTNHHAMAKTGDLSLTLFSDLYAVKIGCVTGDAKYFLLRESDRVRLGLPRESVSPVLSKARHLTSAYMTTKEWKRLLAADERVWLFNPEPKVMRQRAVQEYLQYGRENCDLDAYKLRNRDPWYRVPDVRYGTTGFLSGMTKLGPWICFRSKRQLAATNTLYALTAKTKMSSEERAAWALSLISTSPRRQFHAIARRYPDGLAKLEPHDLNSFRLPTPLRTKRAPEEYARAISYLVAGKVAEAIAVADAFTRRP
jgi:adenine-specific DNA-methyltransferase